MTNKKKQGGWLPEDTGPMTGTDILKNYKRIVKNIFGSGKSVNTTETLTAGPKGYTRKRK